ncbi:hypothetical protein TGMAS_320530, partial [Toxoplasma gondii MAS]
LQAQEPEESADDEAADGRELGKSTYGGYSYTPSSKKTTVQPSYTTKVVRRPKKVDQPAPKKLIRSEPKKSVSYQPKKTVRTVSKKTVSPVPKKAVQAQPKKTLSYRPVIEAQTKKSTHYAPHYTSKKGSY